MAAHAELTYANVAADPILRAWGGRVGARLPGPIASALRDAARLTPPGRIEVTMGRQTYDVL